MFNTERVMRRRLILEEFGPELKYIKVENNVVADDLSCLEMGDNQEILNISELYGYNDEDRLIELIQFVITILANHRKLMLKYNKS